MVLKVEVLGSPVNDNIGDDEMSIMLQYRSLLRVAWCETMVTVHVVRSSVEYGMVHVSFRGCTTGSCFPCKDPTCRILQQTIIPHIQ